jgi:hypothetical protein
LERHVTFPREEKSGRVRIRCFIQTDHLRQIAQQRALTRREFLRPVAVAGAGSQLLGFTPLQAATVPRDQKTVVVTFGGGARDEETFATERQENIPHLMKELIPQATFFTQVVNRGILGHYVATASLATGIYERFGNFADVAPENPTVFEYFRKGLGRPVNDTWVIAPSNGFNRIGQSAGGTFAPGFGARVVLPKHLLAAALGKTSTNPSGLEFLLQDNYEDCSLLRHRCRTRYSSRSLQKCCIFRQMTSRIMPKLCRAPTVG